MPQQPIPEDAMRRVLRDSLGDVIREQVAHLLGSPVDLLGVHVRPLGADHYRVNVLVGEEVTSCRIADSDFLVVDADGKILSSSPEIARRY